MKKEYLKIRYYASIQYKGFYKNTKLYDSLEEMKIALESTYKYEITRDECYSIIDYIIYEIKPIEKFK